MGQRLTPQVLLDHKKYYFDLFLEYLLSDKNLPIKRTQIDKEIYS